jgi:hypothetical protein
MENKRISSAIVEHSRAFSVDFKFLRVAARHSVCFPPLFIGVSVMPRLPPPSFPLPSRQH